MKFASLLAKLGAMDPTALSAHVTPFDLATVNGACMFGLEWRARHRDAGRLHWSICMMSASPGFNLVSTCGVQRGWRMRGYDHL